LIELDRQSATGEHARGRLTFGPVPDSPPTLPNARVDRRRLLLLLLLSVAALVAAHVLDPWAYTVLDWAKPAERDWGRLLRIMGYGPTWLVISIALWLESRRRASPSAEVLRDAAIGTLVAVTVAAIASEVLKMLIRRERPSPTLGLSYQFRAFSEQPLSTRNLGMPSGHATVAFAGAAALNRRFPGAGPVILALAVGCGLTRVFSQAHFLSDAVAGALGGWWVGSFIPGRRPWRRKRLPEATSPG